MGLQNLNKILDKYEQQLGIAGTPSLPNQLAYEMIRRFEKALNIQHRFSIVVYIISKIPMTIPVTDSGRPGTGIDEFSLYSGGGWKETFLLDKSAGSVDPSAATRTVTDADYPSNLAPEYSCPTHTVYREREDEEIYNISEGKQKRT